MTRQTRREIVDALDRHGLLPRKALGQHFLADPNLVEKIIALAEVEAGDRILEVGAGTGALTVGLVARGASVVAYEIDERLAPILADELPAGVDVRFVDVMKVDLNQALSGSGWKLVANLPYNVGTPLLMEVLLGVPVIDLVVVMVQREVADRLVAAPGSGEYGVPSVIVALTTRVVERFSVPPQVFVPPPTVASMVLRLDRVEPPPALRGAVALARQSFGQRRKMLRRSLDHVPAAAFETAGIDPACRPEAVSPGGFVALAEAVGGG